MSLLNNVFIALNKDAQCGSLYVEDTTTYPVTLGSSRVRTDLGIAIFYSKDDFVTVLADLSNSDLGWTFSVDNNSTYIVKAFIVLSWIAGSYTDDEIVYYENFFYQNQSGGATTGIPGVSVDWVELDSADYLLFETELETGSGDFGYTLQSESFDCPLFSIEMTEEHKFVVSDNSGGATINSAKLYDIRDSVIESLTFSSNLASFTTTNNFCGYVYILYDDSEIALLPVIDMIYAKDCGIELTKYIMCACSDPCDEDCYEDDYIKQKRTELLNLNSLLFAINGFIYTDRIKYMGIVSYNSERKDFISKIGEMIEQLNVITERCGLCSSSESNITT